MYSFKCNKKIQLEYRKKSYLHCLQAEIRGGGSIQRRRDDNEKFAI